MLKNKRKLKDLDDVGAKQRRRRLQNIIQVVEGNHRGGSSSSSNGATRSPTAGDIEVAEHEVRHLNDSFNIIQEGDDRRDRLNKFLGPNVTFVELEEHPLMNMRLAIILVVNLIISQIMVVIQILKEDYMKQTRTFL